MYQALSVKLKIFVTSPIWVMPIITVIVNSSYALVKITYMNGVVGFWFFLSIPSVLAFISSIKLFPVYKHEKKGVALIVIYCAGTAFLGTFLTILVIVAGGYVIA